MRLGTFTYGRVNLLSQCRSFAELCLFAVLSTLGPSVSAKKYELKKPPRKKA